jgi:flagellar motility protein MotE (MotC chaperone)
MNGRIAVLGPLTLAALFFGASAAWRVGGGVGQALANVPETTGAETCPAVPEALAAALAEREANLVAREAAAVERDAAMGLAERALEGRLAELEAAEEALAATLAVADQAAERDVTQLTRTFEAMDPDDAAALFAAMAPEFAVGFLGRMNPGAAAEILAGLEPEVAYGISLRLASRNAEAPKE